MRRPIRRLVGELAKAFAPQGNVLGLRPVRVLEVGSRQQQDPSLADLRPLFAEQPSGRRFAYYVGLDRDPGPGVDVVCDFLGSRTRWRKAIEEKLEAGLPDLVLCLDVLEHVPPRHVVEFAMLLDSWSCRGTLLVAVPCKFGIHSLPDYQRWTPQGLDDLLMLEDARRELGTTTFLGWQGEAEFPELVVAGISRGGETGEPPEWLREALRRWVASSQEGQVHVDLEGQINDRICTVGRAPCPNCP